MISISKVLPRYAETDQMGVVHHSVYAIWYEEARTKFLNDVGLPYDTIEKEGVLSVMVELNSNYKKPAYYNQEIEIHTTLVELTPAKFTCKYELFNNEGELINVGKTTLVWADSKTFKIINLKKHNAALYEKLEKLLIKNDVDE